MLVSVKDIHVPRMWIEEHPTLGSHACMLTFYPEFEQAQQTTFEILFVLDLSCSMKDEAVEDMKKGFHFIFVIFVIFVIFNF